MKDSGFRKYLRKINIRFIDDVKLLENDKKFNYDSIIYEEQSARKQIEINKTIDHSYRLIEISDKLLSNHEDILTGMLARVQRLENKEALGLYSQALHDLYLYRFAWNPPTNDDLKTITHIRMYVDPNYNYFDKNYDVDTLDNRLLILRDKYYVMNRITRDRLGRLIDLDLFDTFFESIKDLNYKEDADLDDWIL